MTKKQAKKWLIDNGYSSHYSGKTRTLYVRGIQQSMLDYWNLPVSFNIKGD
jgi:hypothetical protein